MKVENDDMAAHLPHVEVDKKTGRLATGGSIPKRLGKSSSPSLQRSSLAIGTKPMNTPSGEGRRMDRGCRRRLGYQPVRLYGVEA